MKWTFKYTTPAMGKVYHKEGSKSILILYSSIIKLFIEVDAGKSFFPCNAQHTLTRKL